jgi:cytosine/adenosine deaminase-related metal-dependent hydrolase
MAHATQLGDEELGLVAAAGTAIVHCPLSNFYFGDKMFRYVPHRCHVCRAFWGCAVPG